MSLVKRLSNFKTPVVYHLDYLDIVIEDKILLLLSWKFRHKYLLSIPCLKKRYRQRESAIILKVPSHIEVISINISSIWRKRNFKVVLKKLKLDEETSKLLIKQFKPLKMPDVASHEVSIRKQFTAINTPGPYLRKFGLNLRLKEIQLQNEKLIYPS